MKKSYVVPEVRVFSIRPDERIAETCEGWHHWEGAGDWNTEGCFHTGSNGCSVFENQGS